MVIDVLEIESLDDDEVFEASPEGLEKALRSFAKDSVHHKQPDDSVAERVPQVCAKQPDDSVAERVPLVWAKQPEVIRSGTRSPSRSLSLTKRTNFRSNTQSTEYLDSISEPDATHLEASGPSSGPSLVKRTAEKAPYKQPLVAWGAPSRAEERTVADKVKNGKIVFLPVQLNGMRVLVEVEKNTWRAVSSRMSTGLGVGYRKSKRIDDKLEGEMLVYGETVQGTDEGDGWVRCMIHPKTQVLYLPKQIRGQSVVQEETSFQWRAISSPKNSNPGIAFRLSKHLEDKLPGTILPYGEIVQGTDEGDGWLRCEVEVGVVGTQLAFLPLQINGITVLLEEGQGQWRATNEQLQSPAHGIGFRRSKNATDKLQGRILKYGDVIQGTDDGDGWLRCRIPPAEANGKAFGYALRL